jgi:hypothetical protein
VLEFGFGGVQLFLQSENFLGLFVEFLPQSLHLLIVLEDDLVDGLLLQLVRHG